MAMVVVCAWCEKFLGLRHTTESATITHGICGTCAERQYWTDSPTLVVSRCREELVPIFQQLLRGTPEVSVVLDRRVGDRRRSDGSQPPADRRSGDDRRQAIGLLLT